MPRQRIKIVGANAKHITYGFIESMLNELNFFPPINGDGVTYYVTEAVGVSFLTRFSQADIEALREGGEPVAFDVGGFRVGGGIRIKF